MSDCRVPEPQGYDVARLRIEFGDGEVPWMYPLALNGRSIRGVYVDGELFDRVRECEAVRWKSTTSYGVVNEDCSICKSPLDFDKYLDITKVNVRVNYCPNCGARVRGGSE